LGSSGVSTIHAGSPDCATRPGSPSARLQHEPFAQRLEGLELGRARTGVPRLDAAKAQVVLTGLPDRSELPAERAADRRQCLCVDLDRLFGFREDPCDFVLHALELVLGGGSAGFRHDKR
jgi:hypothetical protein